MVTLSNGEESCELESKEEFEICHGAMRNRERVSKVGHEIDGVQL